MSQKRYSVTAPLRGAPRRSVSTPSQLSAESRCERVRVEPVRAQHLVVRAAGRDALDRPHRATGPAVQRGAHRVALAAARDVVVEHDDRRVARDLGEPRAVDVAQPRQRHDRDVAQPIGGGDRLGEQDRDRCRRHTRGHPRARPCRGPATSGAGVRRREAELPRHAHDADVHGPRGLVHAPTPRSARISASVRARGTPCPARCPSARCRGRTGASGPGRRGRCRPGSPRRGPSCPRWRCCRSARWRAATRKQANEWTTGSAPAERERRRPGRPCPARRCRTRRSAPGSASRNGIRPQSR